MGDDAFSVKFAPIDAFKKLRDALGKTVASQTEDFRIIEFSSSGTKVRVQVGGEDEVSQLRVSCDFTGYWLGLIAIMLSIAISFLIFGKFIFGYYYFVPSIPALVFLFAQLIQKEQVEKKRKENIVKKIRRILACEE
jgi:hypothetical protein